MKKKILILLSSLTVGTFACHRPTESKEKLLSNQLRTHKEAADTLRLDQGAETKPLEEKMLPTPEIQALLQKHNLSSVWQANPDNGEAVALYNGFYGADRHRIEIFFASAEQDNTRPNVYRITGKSRFKKSITPFTGEIIIDSVATFHDPNLNQEQIKDMGFKEIYTAAGNFSLREDSTHSGSGVFKGKILVDFGVLENQKVDLWYFSPTRGQGTGFLFDGQWQSYKTGKSKPIVWAKDIFMIGDNILKDFSIGERDVEINPKYRHLGWDSYWENDEWYNAPIAL